MNAEIQQAFEAVYSQNQSWKYGPPGCAIASFEAGWNAAIAQTEAASTPAGSTISAENDLLKPEDCPPYAIYAAYPRKVGKQAAIKAIQKAARDVGADRLYKATLAYAEATTRWPEADKQYIPHPATWFSRGSYDDDPKEWERGTAPASQFSQSH